jgi:alkanesulfonate monooxygenase SsuD/methylene tetrahydromethanopterin reductase-like flavin-dependent oxidoreductase (luciferase family)
VSEPCTTFHGRYFHVEDAILEPKPVQKPPPVMIAGGGEQMTLRAAARLADACNVGGDVATVKHKFAVLRSRCDVAQRDCNTIERTHNFSWLVIRDGAAVAAKRERHAASGPLRRFVGTVSEAIDLVGRIAMPASTCSSTATIETNRRRSPC